MEQVLVYGGLSPWGFPLSELLLERGHSVYSVSSAIDEKERAGEEERALFLGRNALFHEAEQVPDLFFNQVYLTDTFRIRAGAAQQMKKKLNAAFKAIKKKDTQSFVFLSSMAIYGDESGNYSERNPVHPSTEAGMAANDAEMLFVQEMMRRKRSQAIIFRISQMFDRTDSIPSQIAEMTYQLSMTKLSGLEVVHYLTEDPDGSANRKIRNLLGSRFPD